MADENTPFIEMLAMGVKAWDAWQPNAESDDDGLRFPARREQRAITQKLADIFACNPVEVARLLVDLSDRLSKVEREIDPEYNGLAWRVGELESPS